MLGPANLSVQFSLENVSGQDFLIRWYDVFPQETDDPDLFPLTVSLGSFETGYTNDGIEIIGAAVICDTCLFNLRNHQTVTYPYRIDIASFLNWPTRKQLTAGKYWVCLTYTNYWEKRDVEEPVWIGEIHSDTLWFNVTE